jgi:signal transduction histidine kinase
MDLLATATTWLAGFFIWGAIHYAVKWWFSRHERIFLVVAVQCALYTAFCFEMSAFLRASTIPASQAALDRFVTLGILSHVGFLQIYALVSRRRDLAFRILVTAVLVGMVLFHQWAPVRGIVVGLRTIHLPGGLTAVQPIRTPPGAPLALLYLAVLVACGYGFFAARTIWRRDRAGSILINLGAAATLAGAVVGFLIDFVHVPAPYVGAWPHVVFVLCVSLFLSREYAARGARLLASERRAEHALRETRNALAGLQTEQRRREEAEVDRQKAMEGLVHAQRMELVSQLAAGVAHDFNNVLSMIAVWSNIVTDASPSTPEREEARCALASAHEQARALSRQLVALARPDVRSVTRLSLERPIRNTLLTLASALPRDIHLDFEAVALAEVEANETEIQQVVYNLVLNARDAMPAGGTIQVSAGLVTSSIPIEVVGGSLPAGTWATITVQDSGPGIDPAIRDRIFDLFFTTKGSERGTGLGLATVLRIARSSGGGVALETQVGRGATFRVYLPSVGTAQVVVEGPELQPAFSQAVGGG